MREAVGESMSRFSNGNWMSANDHCFKWNEMSQSKELRIFNYKLCFFNLTRGDLCKVTWNNWTCRLFYFMDCVNETWINLDSNDTIVTWRWADHCRVNDCTMTRFNRINSLRVKIVEISRRTKLERGGERVMILIQVIAGEGEGEEIYSVHSTLTNVKDICATKVKFSWSVVLWVMESNFTNNELMACFASFILPVLVRARVWGRVKRPLEWAVILFTALWIVVSSTCCIIYISSALTVSICFTGRIFLFLFFFLLKCYNCSSC